MFRSTKDIKKRSLKYNKSKNDVEQLKTRFTKSNKQPPTKMKLKKAKSFKHPSLGKLVFEIIN